MLNTRFLALFILGLNLCLLPLMATAQTSNRNPMPRNDAPPVLSTADQADIDEAREDLKKMRVLVNQMASNLAFVSDTQSPLKHQFQLEIDMWQMMMTRMQRHLDRLESRRPTPSQ
jgi:hypothetical protein